MIKIRENNFIKIIGIILFIFYIKSLIVNIDILLLNIKLNFLFKVEEIYNRREKEKEVLN